MHIIRTTLLAFGLFLGQHFLAAQSKQLPVSGEILVSFAPGIQPGSVLQSTRLAAGITSLQVEKKVSNTANIWLLKCDPIDEKPALTWLQKQPDVRIVQRNHYVYERSTAPPAPNDPLFDQQWHLRNTGQGGGLPGADLDINTAWDFTTGGLSPAGDTIAVAVIDSGIKASHTDWGNNLWVNRDEIPNDGIDNDENGFTDDYHGWSVYTNTDMIAGISTGHGTAVAGLIAAKGNNSLGISGINWDAKILFVAGGTNNTEDKILTAFDYIRQARLRYNTSQGTQGAFVVALNCSWGIDYGKPEDHPLWCNAFDSLGTAGIITVGATANIGHDVDIQGDMPTNCTSAYFIGVTTLNRNNEKPGTAAWGAQSIDLGAYGTGVYTLASNNDYAAQSGTSFAAPQVSGAIGLLYSAPCNNLIALSKTNPGAAAIWAKQLLLDATQPVEALSGITVTGNRLQIGNLISQYQAQCVECPAPYWLTASAISTTKASLNWLTTSEFQYVRLRWRAIGSTTWNEVFDVHAPYILNDLNPCTAYEFTTRADCNSGAESDWAVPIAFTTDGCCLPPSNLELTEKFITSVTLQWAPVTAAITYHIRYRVTGTTNWTHLDLPTNANSYVLNNLLPCQFYDAQIQTVCDTGATAFSALFTFETAGCGPCLDAVYCPSSSENAASEWIAAVQIGDDWANASEGGPGYQNFAAISATPLVLQPNRAIETTVTPGFSLLTYKEFFRIFIDFNQDGDFDDPGEIAFDPGFAHDGPLTDTLFTPAFSESGLTRMRVTMQYKGVSQILPGPCANIDYGQVEDYCVYLDAEVISTVVLPDQKQVHIYPSPAHENATIQLPFMDESADIAIADIHGRVLYRQKTIAAGVPKIHFDVTPFPSGIYFVQVKQKGILFVCKMIID